MKLIMGGVRTVEDVILHDEELLAEVRTEDNMQLHDLTFIAQTQNPMQFNAFT
jgi:hypothetical protein